MALTDTDALFLTAWMKRRWRAYGKNGVTVSLARATVIATSGVIPSFPSPT